MARVTHGQGGQQGRSSAAQVPGSVTGRRQVKSRVGRLKAAVVFISVSQIVFLPAELPPWVRETPSLAAGHPDAQGEAWTSPKGASGSAPCPVGKQLPGQAQVPGGTGGEISVIVWCLRQAARARVRRGGVALGREMRAKDSRPLYWPASLAPPLTKQP